MTPKCAVSVYLTNPFSFFAASSTRPTRRTGAARSTHPTRRTGAAPPTFSRGVGEHDTRYPGNPAQAEARQARQMFHAAQPHHDPAREKETAIHSK